MNYNFLFAQFIKIPMKISEKSFHLIFKINFHQEHRATKLYQFFCTSLNIKYISAYQPKIDLGPNTRIQLI
jgi:hypothetical protein